MNPKTIVSIKDDAFHINGRPTYEGRTFAGMKIEGLLMNSRMVQGIFDDLNEQTRSRWNYPDGPWDPERNNREFIQNMPLWRKHGLSGFTINFQGGCPTGYASGKQEWDNTAFRPDGTLKGEYQARLKKIIDRADELGMVVILGLFYFGQDERLADERAVIRAVDNAVDWLSAGNYGNVILEIANEVNVGGYEHEILAAKRTHELIAYMRDRSVGRFNTPAGRLLVSTSMGGNSLPTEQITAESDFILLHGNGVKEPARIREMVDQTRAIKTYRGQPILFNEDDHFGFEKPDNNMLAAVSRYAGWGYFDFRMKAEGFDEGYQSMPVNWGISSRRKKGFFDLLKKITCE